MTERITVAVLRQLLRLDEDAGRLYWRHRPVDFFRDTPGRTAAGACAIWNARFAGKEAFTATVSRGYRAGHIFDRQYRAHRVVFALHHGRWPDGGVDHQDGDPCNNMPGNLREATQAQNGRNVGSRGGTSRFCGVSWYKRGRKWVAYCKGGGRRHIGYFSEEVDAARAYDAAARERHGRFARLNFPEVPK